MKRERRQRAIDGSIKWVYTHELNEWLSMAGYWFSKSAGSAQFSWHRAWRTPNINLKSSKDYGINWLMLKESLQISRDSEWVVLTIWRNMFRTVDRIWVTHQCVPERY
jgi:hypothetical protein